MGRTNQLQPSRSAGLTLSLHRCQVCSDTTVVLGAGPGGLDCHGEAMVRTDDTDCQVGRTALSIQLRDTFGIPQSGTDICYALLADDLQSVAAIADRTGHECRTVQTHLARLEANDLLDGATLPREDGGNVEVYHTEREALPTTLLAFCLWATWAAGESVASVDLAGPDRDPSTVFWTAFCDGDEQSVRC